VHLRMRRTIQPCPDTERRTRAQVRSRPSETNGRAVSELVLVCNGIGASNDSAPASCHTDRMLTLQVW
jgi:hypothetical protein